MDVIHGSSYEGVITYNDGCVHSMTEGEIIQTERPYSIGISVKMHSDTKELILREAMKRHSEVSAFIRKAIERALEQQIDLMTIPDPDQLDFGGNRRALLTFKVQPDFLEKWDRYIKDINISRSNAIRRAVYDLIMMEKPKDEQIIARVYKIKL